MPVGAQKVKYSIGVRIWNAPAIALFFIITGLIAVHWGTVESLSNYWLHDFTYGHGLLVVPLSFYLLWRKQGQINSGGYSPSYTGLISFLLLNLAWLPAYLTDVEIVQQLDLLAMIAVLFPALLGWRKAYLFSFPLLFPFIAMPLWSWLQPLLQYVTTHVVAFSLSTVGVPVFVKAHFIRIPEGEFSIEEVCAGLRYLLAALAISMVYVHLYIKKLRTAFLFLTFSVVLSLLVNWVRVFTVIVAGHLTNMQHSLVRDHANFGWWLFAFTLIPIFWFGNYLLNKEQLDSGDVLEKEIATAVRQPKAKGHRIYYVMASILVIALVFPLTGYYVKSQGRLNSTGHSTKLTVPTMLADWQGPVEVTQDNLKPRFQGADASFAANYIKNGKKVFFFTANYRYQKQGKELIFWGNSLFDRSVWKLESKSTRRIALKNNNNGVLQIEENVVRNPIGKTRVLWYWYSVAGVNTVKPAIAKALIIKDLFSKNKMGSNVYLLASGVDIGVDQARRLLTEYLREARNIQGL